MKRCFLLFACTVFSYVVGAQDLVISKIKSETSRTIKKEADTSTWNWKRGGLLNFNLSQGSLSNWAAGGDNFTLAISGYWNYYFYYKRHRHSWDNNLDMNLGFVKATSLGGRKNDDRVDFLSKYGYKMDSLGTWYISGLFNFRSQLFDGYTYSGGIGELTSTFLSPSYLIVSAGFDYKPSDRFSVFMSPLTSRSTFLTKKELSDKGAYGIPKGSYILSQVGAFASVNYNNPALFSQVGISGKELFNNIGYKGRLDLFSNYGNKPQNVDIFMTNFFSFKINKYFSATYNLDLIYDDDVRLFGPLKTSPGLQLKSLIGIGFLKPLAVRKIKYTPAIDG